jgi:hypothetical protein
MEPGNGTARTSNPAVTCRGFEIHTAVTMKDAIFSEVTPCNVVKFTDVSEKLSLSLHIQVPRYVK